MKYKIIIVTLSAFVATLVHFPELVSMLNFQDNFKPFGEISLLDVTSEIGYLFLTLLFLFWLNAAVFKFNDRQHKIKWRWIIISFFATWLLSSGIAHLFVIIHQYYSIPAINVTLHHYLHPLRDIIIALVVTIGSYLIYLVNRQQAIVIENQELRTENLRNQYESLKNQLNPHMFFNSLNTLNTLIRESPSKAQSYTYELSKVLRYTLKASEPRGVSLSQEMDFVNAYLYLLKTRYEENLNFQIHIDNSLEDYFLPPMAIQMLIENAVKHNEISNKKPMHISIIASNNCIVVSNPIQPKLSPYVGEGIGIKNLNKRYELLYKTEISISTANQMYTVTLPLIKQIDESFNN